MKSIPKLKQSSTCGKTNVSKYVVTCWDVNIMEFEKIVT